MRLSRYLYPVLILIILACEPVSGYGIDGTFSNLRGLRPYPLGKGRLGLALFEEYSQADLRSGYVGEYFMSTRAALSYGLTRRLDLKVNMPYYVDVLDNFRYGPGDLSLGCKWMPTFLHYSSWYNGLQVMIALPSGFKENPAVKAYPYLRPFSARKTSFLFSYHTEFQYNQFSFTANLSYFTLPHSDSLMYKNQLLYRIGEGYQGLDVTGAMGTSCPQYPFVISLAYQWHPKCCLYLEYAGAMLRSRAVQINDPVTLTPGLSWTISKNLSLNGGVDFDLFETMPDYTIVFGLNFVRDLLSVPIAVEDYPITPENIVTIAVIDFIDMPQKGQAQKISTRLKEKLIFSGDFKLIDDEILSKTIQELGITPQTILLKSTLERLGRTMNVDYVVAGQILQDDLRPAQLKGIPFIIGRGGVVYHNQGTLSIITPETGDYIYNNRIEAVASLSRGLYFMGIDPLSPRYFTNLQEKNALTEKNCEHYVSEVLSVLYQKFYNMEGERLSEHLQKKNFFPKR